ncbi:MAG: hypothetical protein ABSA86_02565 [Oryzomonas sp.]
MTQKLDSYFTPLPLRDIKIHKTILDYQNIIDPTYLLRHADRFTSDGVQQLLTLHPIHVIVERKKYYCIAGIRQLNIATVCLDDEASIPVRLMKGLTGEQIKDLYLADLFLTSLVFSVENARVIDAIRQAVGIEAGKWTGLADCSKSQLAKALGLSSANLYYDRKTTKRG